MSSPDVEHLRALAPQVLGVLVRRGHDLTAAEDAVQEALVEAWRRWPDGRPDDPRAWLVTVAGRRLLDAYRSDTARRRREEAVLDEPVAGPAAQSDDTLQLLFLCCHPALSPSSAVALTLRAVGGLTTREIAEAYLVPEATMAQRISRAKRTVDGERFRTPGELPVVLRVLYLIFTEGYGGRVDLAAEAIRLARLLHGLTDDAEVTGLLALMLLHHARRDARTDGAGRVVPLDRQDRASWRTYEIAEGVALLQDALAAGPRGEYQLQAAIAALHDDAATAAETDWPQIVQWYDELVALTDNPLALLSRAVAIGEADGPQAGLRALDDVAGRLPGHHRVHAVRARLLEHVGDAVGAAKQYGLAADGARSTAERDHLIREAARVRAG